jgi:hypothetical protein
MNASYIDFCPPHKAQHLNQLVKALKGDEDAIVERIMVG